MLQRPLLELLEVCLARVNRSTNTTVVALVTENKEPLISDVKKKQVGCVGCYRFRTIPSSKSSSFIFAAARRPRAKVSMPLMCAMNRSTVTKKGNEIGGLHRSGVEEQKNRNNDSKDDVTMSHDGAIAYPRDRWTRGEPWRQSSDHRERDHFGR